MSGTQISAPTEMLTFISELANGPPFPFTIWAEMFREQLAMLTAKGEPLVLYLVRRRPSLLH